MVAAVYEALLFLHVLAAFALIASVVVYSAVALGPSTAGMIRVGSILWDVGGIGTIVLGVALAIDVDAYDIFDGWILASIVLWAIAAEVGRRANEGMKPAELAPAAGGLRSVASGAVSLHWLRALVAIAILVLMILKPGAGVVG
jgi:hypothetical protein